MIKAWRDKLERRRLSAKKGRNLCRRLSRRALTVAGPEPSASRIPDAVAGPFLETIRRDLCDLIENETAVHQNAEVRLKMLFFTLTFGVAEPSEQRKAVEHDRRVGGKHHVRQTRNARHDLQPCPGGGECRGERLKAAPGRGQVTYRIFGPRVRPHPWVDCVAHLEVG